MLINSTGLGDSEPLAVSPRRTAFLLDCGVTRVYELINSRQLESYKDGASRKIVTASVREYIRRQLERSRAA
jgi:excisionase family DNA binding protein